MRFPTVGKFLDTDVHAMGNGVMACEWSPGTGIKFRMFASIIPEGAGGRVMGTGDGSVMASVETVRGWFSIPLVDGALHHESYVAEKLRHVSSIGWERELMEITALLNLTVGDEAYGREIYAQLMTPNAAR